MRISDWSSDVCSSDLIGHGLHQDLRDVGPDHVEVAQRRLGGAGQALAIGLRRRLDLGVLGGEGGRGAEGDRPEGERQDVSHGDRKSVVWGKSVSVRLDLGGRRIIKKKKTRKKN